MNRDELPQMFAAGGLVLCGGYALVIRKHRLLDLPKGKLDYPDEPYEECALREISEETGLDPGLIAIRAPLCRTNYISYYRIGPVNKTVQWFLLDYAGELTDSLQPDLSEGIDQCQWVALPDLMAKLRASRPYLRPVRQAIERELYSTPAPLP
jgi:8-oxo-dGTP pyrophosphatase MutT (NUDIX family)